MPNSAIHHICSSNFDFYLYGFKRGNGRKGVINEKEKNNKRV